MLDRLPSPCLAAVCILHRPAGIFSIFCLRYTAARAIESARWTVLTTKARRRSATSISQRPIQQRWEDLWWASIACFMRVPGRFHSTCDRLLGGQGPSYAATRPTRRSSLPYLLDARLKLGHVRHVPRLRALDLEQALRRHLQPVFAMALLHQSLLGCIMAMMEWFWVTSNCIPGRGHDPSRTRRAGHTNLATR